MSYAHCRLVYSLYLTFTPTSNNCLIKIGQTKESKSYLLATIIFIMQFVFMSNIHNLTTVAVRY